MKALILATAFSVPALASAQTTIITEPVMLPIERDSAGVVKAQYIKPGDVTPEQYQALLAEAAKVQAFQQPSYVVVDGTTGATTQELTSQTTTVQSYANAGSTFGSSTPVVSADIRHTVVKGDTLFNIAKRNGVSVDQLKSANALSGNAIGLGQSLLIPSATIPTVVERPTISAYNTQTNVYQASQQPLVSQPLVSQPYVGQPYVSEPFVSQPASSETIAAPVTYGATTSRPYAVLPGDTLYGISRRACVSVDAIQTTNGLGDTAIRPGQKLTMPQGHCLR